MNQIKINNFTHHGLMTLNKLLLIDSNLMASSEINFKLEDLREVMRKGRYGEIFGRNLMVSRYISPETYVFAQDPIIFGKINPEAEISTKEATNAIMAFMENCVQSKSH